MITIDTRTKLSIKELAAPLRRSVSFIYKARMAGLPMDWDEEARCYVTTEDDVRKWIKRKKFSVVKGRPSVG